MPIYNRFSTVQRPGATSQPFPPGLRITGPIVSVQIEVPQALATQLQRSGQAVPSAVAGLALVDTGASISAVDITVIQHLGVQPVGIATVGTAGGPQQQAIFPARLSFPGTQVPSIEFNELLGANLAGQSVPGIGGNLIALLGRDLLEHFILIYNGPAGMFSLAF